MPAATATFSDSAPWASGIATRLADTALSCGRMPAPSLPTITAIGPSDCPGPPSPSARGSGTPSAAAAHKVTPCRRSTAMKAVSSSATTGCRKVAPMAARSALGLSVSAVPRRTTVPAAPRACAVRMSVPTFPGSCTPSMTRAVLRTPPSGMSSAAQVRGSTTATLQSAPPARRRRAPDGARVKIALTIAGSDSGGGAGVQADLKTFHQFGVFGTSVITAVTAQNTVGVRAWQALPAALVTKQIDALADDLPPAAVKSGMLASAELVETVAAGIAGRRLPNYVLDPVMLATSGDRLLNADAEHLIARRLVPLARLVTPNLGEAAILAGTDVRNPADMESAARAPVQLGAKAALVKGGHLAGDEIVDVLVSDRTVRRFPRARLDTTSTHGTGCTLSAAIAAGLAHGRPLERAIEDALDFVSRAMAAAPGLGKGHGPLNHFVPAPPRPPTNGL